MSDFVSTSISTKVDERGVAVVTLNNPEKHNAFDDAIIAQLQAAFDEVAANTAVRAMVLASNGRSFSAGADLGWMKRMAGYSHAENLRDSEALAAMLRRLGSLPMPTIARVQGAAFGGAVGLVSCCDMAVAGPRAAFSLSEVKIGLIPATISPYVIAAIGARAARRYFQTGERFSAAAAERLGLVSLCVDDEAGLDLNALSRSVERISELKGVGSATASALLSRYNPRLFPFMSDEVLVVAGNRERKHTLKRYLQLAEEVAAKARETGMAADEVERAIWASTVLNGT